MSNHLLKFQIGPVQDFIAAARSTRDLWSGSYLFGFLVAAGIRHLQKNNAELIFPNPGEQPLLGDPESWKSLPDRKALLTPNLPNLFVATIPSEGAKKLAEAVKQAITEEWRTIANAVWRKHGELGIHASKKTVFDNAVKNHLSIAWQITPIEADYAKAYQDNGKHLDAVRQLRDFDAWGTGQWTVGGEKDSLTGKEEALCGGTDFRDAMSKKDGELFALFKHSDHVGAITLVKRIWHLAYLSEKKNLNTRSKSFNIRSIPAIAARQDEHDDEGEPQEKTTGDKYIAAIAFDGDSIGAWVNGDKLPDTAGLRQHHENFSRCLSDFALKRVRAIVEEEVDGTDKEGNPIQVPLGQLIYAGGDDVVALVPADEAIQIAKELREAFRDATGTIEGENGEKPDASAGIAIAHIHSPLQDLIRAAQKAEKRAKTEVGRPAFSVTLMKRSGEITEWGSQWVSGGVELYQAIAERLDDGRLSAKFPHRVCQLLEPYLTVRSGLSKQTDAIDDATAKDLITREFAFAIERQSSPDHKKSNLSTLAGMAETYLDSVLAARLVRGQSGKPSALTEPQELLASLIGLCTTVAFAHRTQPQADKQSAA